MMLGAGETTTDSAVRAPIANICTHCLGAFQLPPLTLLAIRGEHEILATASRMYLPCSDSVFGPFGAWHRGLI